MTKLETLVDKLKSLHLPKVETLKPTLEEIEIENSLNMFQLWLNENLEKEFKANTLPSTGVKQLNRDWKRLADLYAMSQWYEVSSLE